MKRHSVTRFAISSTNAATHGAGPAPTEVVVDVAGPWVEIAVLDRGPGLDPAETERFSRPCLPVAARARA